MDTKDLRLKHLTDVTTNIAVGDHESASAAFHDLLTLAYKTFVEGDDPKSNPGDASVKATMKLAGDKEIPKKGESKDDPKKAPGDASVKATMKSAGDKELPKKGESKDDPKKAPGDASVKATMKSAGDKEIK